MIHSGLKGVSFSTTRFLRWWGGELAGCLPARWRRQWRQQDATLWLSYEHDRLKAHQPQSDRVDPVPLAQARDQSCVLLLPPHLCLRHRVELPMAVEADLAQVLCFELDRLTPFTPQQAYFDYRVIGRDSKQQLLQLELLLIPQQAADELLQRVADSGLLLRQVTVLGSDGELEPFNLLPRERLQGAGQTPRWVNGLLLGTALVLATIWLLRPVYQSQAQVDALQPQLMEARGEAEAVRSLKQQLEALALGDAFLERRRQHHKAPLELLRELTLILPDDIWLQQLQLTGDEITLQGQAPAAAQVVQLLESSPLLYGVSFRSPVVRDVRTGAESFFLSARLVEVAP